MTNKLHFGDSFAGKWYLNVGGITVPQEEGVVPIGENGLSRQRLAGSVRQEIKAVRWTPEGALRIVWESNLEQG